MSEGTQNGVEVWIKRIRIGRGQEMREGGIRTGKRARGERRTGEGIKEWVME